MMRAIPAQATSQTAVGEGAERLNNAPPDLWASMLNMLFVLALVIALIILLGWLFRRFAGTGFGIGQGGFLQVVSSAALGERRHVAVVRAGERYFLLGLTQNEVSLITELDKAAVEAGTQAPPPGDSPFARILRRATGRDKEAGS